MIIKPLIASFILFFAFYFSPAQQCQLDPVTDVTFTEVTACSFTVSWTSTTGASKYKIRIRQTGTATWSAYVSTGLDTFYTYNNLLAGIQYEVMVKAFCTDGSTYTTKKKKYTTESCTELLSQNFSITGSESVILSAVFECSISPVIYRYKPIDSSNWITDTATTPLSVSITGLLPGEEYEYQFSICITDTNWAAPDTFAVSAQPNIILFLLDDARADMYSCNGAPPFVQTPHIDRIANEGVNFKNYYAVCSICAPGRAAIATGLYPHKNGIVNNLPSQELEEGVPTIAEILHDSGYETYLFGKNHDVFEYNSGDFDYWFTSNSLDLFQPVKFTRNGITTYIDGYITDIIIDSAVQKITESSNPFFMWIAFKAPHEPLLPVEPFDGMFDTEAMPVGGDTAAFSENYPSWIDNTSANYKIFGDSIASKYRDTYETTVWLDSAIGRVLQQLEQQNELDNTMIIFTSDNGFLFGEHTLYMKRVAYEPSIRQPLFIRYPAWFDSASVIADQFALNVDLSTTMLQAAGINLPIETDGISLKELYDETATRNEILYHYQWSKESGYKNLPEITAVRSAEFKLVQYGCQTPTEEFFDVQNDPGETVNLIHHAAYDSVIQVYRQKLEALKQQYETPEIDSLLDCYLINEQFYKEAGTIPASSESIKVFPNPAGDWIDVQFMNSDENYWIITTLAGQLISKGSGGQPGMRIMLTSFPRGSYILSSFGNERFESVQFEVQ